MFHDNFLRLCLCMMCIIPFSLLLSLSLSLFYLIKFKPCFEKSFVFLHRFVETFGMLKKRREEKRNIHYAHQTKYYYLEMCFDKHKFSSSFLLLSLFCMSENQCLRFNNTEKRREERRRKKRNPIVWWYSFYANSGKINLFVQYTTHREEKHI